MQSRPDPDALLQEVQRREEYGRKGRLKIFLGSVAGVGKTFAMLSEAQEQRDRGLNVLVGYVETHGRRETDALLEGLRQLAPLMTPYKGVELREFDVDAALLEHPDLVLVDELAHTNAPGLRHAKRWQDIEELLRAGISVYTTVNVQHLESLNDVVAQITGVTVKETVPDSFIENADDIEVVDIPPEELQQRLREGKIYLPERVEHALEGFFKKGNLIALRELALRRAADRVDAEMQNYRSAYGVSGLWPTRERVLVCVAPNRMAERVVRSAGRIGASSHAEMIAVYVESDRQSSRSADERAMAESALRLAEGLGMHTVTVAGHDIVAQVLEEARRRNVNLIVVGKPIRPRWKELIRGSVVDELVRRSGEIDVHVITADEREMRTLRRTKPAALSTRGYLWTIGIVGIATGVCLLLHGVFNITNLAMFYLLAVTIVASRFGPREAVLASILSVALFDFGFVPPRFTFNVSDTEYLLTFGVMLAVALVISTLTLRIREEARMAAEREKRTSALYDFARGIAKTSDREELARVAAREIRNVFTGDVAILIFEEGEMRSLAPSGEGFENDEREQITARWTLQHGERSGRGTSTLPSSSAIYFPLKSGQRTIGVLGFRPHDSAEMTAGQQSFLETFCSGLAVAIERSQLARESQDARLEASSERLRNALLSSISHDLRTPLTAIAGAASSLHEGLGDPKELSGTIYDQSMRLNVHVQNLLDMTRLQSGHVEPRLEWQSLEELVGSALDATGHLLEGRDVKVEIPPDMPLVFVDGSLINRVFVNILENAVAHTPAGTPLDIKGRVQRDEVVLEFADNGPGIPEGQESKIFERFYQTEEERGDGGFGLGLAICRAILRLHKGRIWAKNRPTGGAVFVVELPKPSDAPEVPVG